MELNLDVEKINFMEPLFKGCGASEDMAEVIVPDAQPDAARIISAAGTALLRSKDVNENGFSVTGVVEGTVIYAPDNGEGVKKLDVSVPFEKRFDVEGITEESLITSSVELQKLTAGIINPRKLSVRAEVIVTAEVYDAGEEDVLSVGGENGCGIEVLQKCVTVEVPASVNEKTFGVTDELAVSASKPDVRDILSVCAHIYGDEVKGVGTKVVVRGRVVTDVVFLSETGSAESEKFTSPFSQIVETDTLCEDNYSDVCLALTGVYVSRGIPNANGESILQLEANAVVQCVTYKSVDIEYIADTYSTRYEIDIEQDKIVLPRVTGRFSMTKTVAATVETAGRARDVIAVNITSDCAHVSSREVSAELGISVLYVSENGELMAAYRTLKAETDFDLDGGENIFADVSWEGEAFVNTMGGGIEIRFPVKFTAVSMAADAMTMVSGVRYEDDALLDTSGIPSLTVYRTRGCDDLWELGKKYCSTGEMILTANDIEGNAPLPAGIMIVIPKKR